ncbi:MFS transporter [Shimia biformata]|uniref:MFS transporter n=1 Tax=Shimia biformata TaxID=1294299 RepID=UPI00194F5893|nr:MFS transporter [Shimia biformata]
MSDPISGPTSDPKLSPAPLTYRWVVLAAATLILAIGIGGIVNGMSAFIVPMQEAWGWQRGQTSLINFAGILGLAFGGLFFGRLSDRTGPLRPILLGVVVVSLTYVLVAFAAQLWQFYLIFLVGGFFGAGAFYVPLLALVPAWFRTGPGLAIGVVSAGQALGQGGFPFLASFLIGQYGIHWAFGICGAIMLVTLVPLALLLRSAPQVEGADKTRAEAIERGLPPTRTVVIWLCAAILLCCTCMSVPLMHLVPLIRDTGIAIGDAGSVIFVMLMVGVLGRVAFGKFADMIGALNAYVIAVAWMTLLVAGFLRIDSLGGFYTYAVIYGFGYAGVMTGILASVAALTPAAKRASAMGFVTLFGWFGHAIGGSMGGILFDLTGDYNATFVTAALFGAANLIVVTLFRLRLRGPRQPAGAAA